MLVESKNEYLMDSESYQYTSEAIPVKFDKENGIMYVDNETKGRYGNFYLKRQLMRYLTKIFL